MSKPLLLEEAEQALARAAHKAEASRRQYNADVAAWKEAKAQCQRLRDKWAVVLVDLEDERQRALKAGDPLAALYSTKPPGLR